MERQTIVTNSHHLPVVSESDATQVSRAGLLPSLNIASWTEGHTAVYPRASFRDCLKGRTLGLLPTWELREHLRRSDRISLRSYLLVCG